MQKCSLQVLNIIIIIIIVIIIIIIIIISFSISISIINIISYYYSRRQIFRNLYSFVLDLLQK